MKKRAFAAFLVILVLFLIILWEQDRRHKTELTNMEARFNWLQSEMRVLRLRAQALKAEIEMTEISNHLQTLKGLSSRRFGADQIQSQGEQK